MNRTWPILLFLLIGLNAYAQPQFQSVYWRGYANISFRSYNQGQSSSDKFISFNVAPGFGFCLSDKFIAGISLKFGNSVSGIPSSRNVSTSYATESFLKYFKNMDAGKRLFFSPEIKIEFGDQSSKTITPYKVFDHGDTRYMNAGIYPGFSFYFNKNLALELIAGGIYFNSQQQNSIQSGSYIKRTDKSFNVQINPGDFRFGLSYLIH